ncbi:hypothetical protein CSC2_32370 [Clostridium zeae]|uniref:Bifunctional diguanylate cyclase/phosphodiesterase n=1 Tax=Clostridium zeae TaxID=2759022 RepID=A0ABQ1ED83_9CLOT|nr:bifunctional diguanylate cyclase/phosphodiesterase [Clostridium zeae]GFZ32711.1 hypothetical protein CSC2_32370 [Clostridium zeae]
MNSNFEKKVFKPNFYNLSYSFKEMNLIIDENIKRNGSIILVIFDIEDFKAINMIYGYDFGNLVLDKMMSIIKEIYSTNGSIFRFCGDKYIHINSEKKDINNIISMSEKLLNRVKEPLIVYGQEVCITLSIGISLYSDYTSPPQEVMQQAEIALEQAKVEGGSCYKVFDKQNNLIIEKLLAMDLKKALYMKQFLLYFQPQFNIDDNSIQSAEVLIRWKHEIEGIIKPDKFIKIVEENNFGIELGNWVIRESCRQNMIWKQKGLQPIPLSINISQGQFYDKDFISNLEDILLEFDLEPKYLQLEITERIFINSYDTALNIIKDIKNLGIKVLLDDFGTGNSSLLSAMSLPFDIIKLDKFFLNNIEYDLNKRNQTARILKFLKSINDNIIIEGIENNVQLEFIKKHGFNKVQGFLLSYPLECSSFEELLKQAEVIDKR